MLSWSIVKYIWSWWGGKASWHDWPGLDLPWEPGSPIDHCCCDNLFSIYPTLLLSSAVASKWVGWWSAQTPGLKGQFLGYIPLQNSLTLPVARGEGPPSSLPLGYSAWALSWAKIFTFLDVTDCPICFSETGSRSSVSHSRLPTSHNGGMAFQFCGNTLVSCLDYRVLTIF